MGGLQVGGYSVYNCAILNCAIQAPTKGVRLLAQSPEGHPQMHKHSGPGPQHVLQQAVQDQPRDSAGFPRPALPLPHSAEVAGVAGFQARARQVWLASFFFAHFTPHSTRRGIQEFFCQFGYSVNSVESVWQFALKCGSGPPLGKRTGHAAHLRRT